MDLGKNTILWSVLLVLIGSILLLVRLGALPADLVSYWPLILVIVGLMGLSNVGDSGAKKQTKKKTTRKKKKK